MKNRYPFLLLIAVLLTGCMAGPNFRSPVVEMPVQFTDAATNNQVAAKLGGAGVFADTTLQRLISHAIVANRDLKVALSRVEQARIALNAARSELYPSLSYQATGQYGDRTALGGRAPKPEQAYAIVPQLSWELDLWGKVRRATESAKNQLWASDYAARATLLSLTTEVATTYFTLLQYEESLRVAQQSFDSRRISNALMQLQYSVGNISGLDLKQSEQQLYTAGVAIPQYQRAVEQTTHALCLLLGVNPGSIIGKHTPLLDQPLTETIPVGLPSELLEQRPDVMEAYFNLASQNAQIGVAQAMRYPSIALTGSGGVFNVDIRDLFQAKSAQWQAAVSLTGPIFEFGRNKRRVEVAREQTKEALFNYEQSVLRALSEVEDALTATRTLAQQAEAARLLMEAARTTQQFAHQLYEGGFTSYLEVQSADRTLFDAELSYAEVRQQQLSASITLYKALGCLPTEGS